MEEGRTDNTRAKRKRTNNDLQSITQKTMIEQHEPHKKLDVITGDPEG